MSYIESNDGVSKLAEAMCKVQSEVENVIKEADNPFFRTKYADLGSILAHCRPILSKHGLSIIQFPINLGESVGVETILMHESGQCVKESICVPMPVDAKNVAQAVGSIITYLRRYAYAAVVGIAQVDDDGSIDKTVSPVVEMITDSQVQRINIIMKDVRVFDKANALMNKKGKTFEKLTKEEASSFIQWANDLVRTSGE